MSRRTGAAALGASAALALLAGCPEGAPSEGVRTPGAGAAGPVASTAAASSGEASEPAPPAARVVAGVRVPAEARPRALDPGEAPAEREGVVARVVDGAGVYPRAVAVAADGGFYTVDREGVLRAFAADARPRARARIPDVENGTPTGLAVDGAERLLVADSHQSRLLVYDRELELRDAWGEPGREPGRLMLVSGVAVGPEGRVWVTDYGDDVARVQAFTPEGDGVLAFGRFGSRAGELRRPMDLAFDPPRRRLAVADAVNHRVQVFDLEGGFQAVWSGLGDAPGELKHPYAVAFDAAGRLFVASFGNHRLEVFGPDGAPLASWGEPGLGEGQLAWPWGLALAPDDGLLLLDSGADRLYRLRRSALLAAAR